MQNYGNTTMYLTVDSIVHASLGNDFGNYVWHILLEADIRLGTSFHRLFLANTTAEDRSKRVDAAYRTASRLRSWVRDVLEILNRRNQNAAVQLTIALQLWEIERLVLIDMQNWVAAQQVQSEASPVLSNTLSE